MPPRHEAALVHSIFVTPADPPWLQCHASTLWTAPDGTRVVAFFAGTAEGTKDTRLWSTRCDPVSRRWQQVECVSEGEGPFWNPVLASAPDGSLWLFAKRGGPISRWESLVRSSRDGGRTWSATSLLAPDVPAAGPVKNPPVVLPTGRWVAGASVERPSRDPGAPDDWRCYVDLSDDAGRSWHRHPIPHDRTACPGAGLIQPTLWRGRDGHLVALMRSTSGRVWRSTSDDDGETWTSARPTGLPNNNSGLCAVALSDGRVAAAHNTSSVPWGPRNELVLSLSDDDGITWRQALTIDVLPDPPSTPSGRDDGVLTDGVGELSYPTLVRDKGTLGSDPDAPGSDHLVVSYTWQRRHIVVADIPTELLHR